MKFNNIHSCHIGPEISPEQFIPEHFFLYLLSGSMIAYDGKNSYSMKPGDYCIARKNHLVRYTKFRQDDSFEKIIITLDEPFLRNFQTRHPLKVEAVANDNSFLFVPETKFISNYIRSLEPYYNGDLQIDETFADVKREELLLILLKSDKQLANVLFNYSIPDKLDLEEFMLRNFRFNVSMDRFAFLTGRSLSAFKRDFKTIFNEAPRRWLMKKRLEEAHFLIQKQHRKPADIYIDLGFEDLSHFSFAFKKTFGKAPTEVTSVN
ncbi:AraC family transcriptional regulator [Dyadobacter sp. CY312]|uniref:helix-turn-helix domain-containing protein n=1 Tax=Dyadobacter sp. CY312 TaxID=2907303 RepID=UPI001F422CD0|nr:AraC family transcriptional regulator [Dyadobacter sp. CY312]MCE7039057.1 AraC family transcriptional regulator [Dyadobacter sp. CY312]